MKKNRRFYLIIIVLGLCVYFGLLLILLEAESTSDSSAIRTFADALWYSIVTLTTVGYGDITPVTMAGRMVGLIFLVLSMGILVTLVGTFLSFLTSEGFPLLTLSFVKKKNWYYFADADLEAETLAQHIIKEDRNAVIIYGCSKSSLEEMPDYACLFANVSPERIAKAKGKKGSRCKVFFMKENDIGVNPRAVEIAELPVVVYARTASGEDTLAGDIHFFHSYDCCAREYWRKKSLRFHEHSIVLLGFGKYGEALLTRAIMTNVIRPEQRVTYHVFGDVGEFLHMHPGIRQAFRVVEEQTKRDAREKKYFTEDRDEADEYITEKGRVATTETVETENENAAVRNTTRSAERMKAGGEVTANDNYASDDNEKSYGMPLEPMDRRDSIIFHARPWTEERDILESADRIIICEDNEQTGWDIFWKIRQFYRVSGKVHLRSNRIIPGVDHFGTNESIYTPENVLRTELNKVAISMNNLYRNSHSVGALDWNQLDDYLRQSKIAASEHLFFKVRILLQDDHIRELTTGNLAMAYRVYKERSKDPEQLDYYRRVEHQRWIRFYTFYNWTYGPAHNRQLRQDPRICDYDLLSEHLKRDCDYSWELLGEIQLGES